MNKQEAIEKATERMKQLHMGGTIWVNKDDVIDIISKIDEPQKPVIPKYVAEWIEECKRDRFYALHGAFANMDNKLKRWRAQGCHSELFAKAWMYGYEIEKEKLYTVEIPNNGGTLVLASIRYAIQLVDSNKHFPGKFTKESIEEAGFGWVFGCDGVKVVEEK